MQTKTKKLYAFTIAVFVAGFAWQLVASPAKAADELNFLAWCDHVDTRLIQPFEERYGVKVNVKGFDTMGSAIAILEQSQPGDWDVFTSEIWELEWLAREGNFAELDPDDFNWDDFWEHEHERHFVDGKLYGVPGKWGFLALAYNDDKVDAADLQNYSGLWNPKYAGRVIIYDYYTYTMSVIAVGMGLDPATMTVEDVGMVRDEIIKLKEAGAPVADTVGSINMLSSGEGDILIAGGDWAVGFLRSEFPNLKYIVPEEGAVYWSTTFNIFAGSENKDLALKFIHYMLEPEAQALLATADCYWGTPISKSAALSDDEKEFFGWDKVEQNLKNRATPVISSERPDIDQAMIEAWEDVLAH